MEKQGILKILRSLNENNINNDPEVREAFFNKLLFEDNRIPNYSKSWDEMSLESRKKHIISDLVSSHITCYQTDFAVEWGKEYAVIGYIMGIMWFKKSVLETPFFFAELKDTLLWGLIMKYIIQFSNTKCQSTEPLKVLNDLMVILGEHIYCLEPNDNEPYIIDEEFLSKLIKTIESERPRESDGMKILDKFRPIVMEFIQRVFGGQNKKARYPK